MKKTLLFNSLMICFLGLFMQSRSLAGNTMAMALSNTEAESFEALFSLPPACYTPTWPTTSNITQTSATFSWDPMSGAQSYSVQTRLPNGTWMTIPNNPIYYNYVTVNGLNPNTTYEWRVRTNCSGGQYSSWTYGVLFTTSGNGGYCYPPEWLYTTNITQTSATWDWSSVNGCINYTVQWRYPGGSWNTLQGGPFTNSYVNVGGLNPNTTYEWRVRSNCGNGSYSDWSYPASFTTLGNSCNTPSWTNTSNITQNSATFEWSESWGAQYYQVQIRLPNGTWYDIQGNPVYGTWVSVNGLDPNTTYQWRVRACCGYGNYSSWTYPTNFTTSGASYCYAPSWLYTSGITQSAATFDWDPVNGAVSYTVEYRVSGGSWYTLQGSPFTGSWASVSGLTACTTYQWRVRSNCAYGNYSLWSDIVNFTTLCNVCNTPSYTYTNYITQNSANFSWGAVSGAQSYTVQTRLQNGTWYDLPGGAVYNTNVTVNSLNPNTTYQWRVRANCSNWQYSDWTYPMTFTTLGGSCEAPSWLYTSNITDHSATWTWSAISGAINYSIEWRIWGGSWSSLSGGPWSGTWVSVTNLNPSTTYEWRVRANCGNGYYSQWSNPAVFTTLGYSCSVPTWPMTSNVTQTSASFSWDYVAGAQSYSVQVRQLNGPWYDILGNPFYGTTASVNGLDPNTTYEWRVRANCGGGQYSGWTQPISFTTYGAYCQAPAWLFETNITQSSATLNWDAVSGAGSYSVQWKVWGGNTWFNLSGPFYNTWAGISGLNPGVTYEWRVRSNCSNGNVSDWSYPDSFTTLGYNCNTPSWVTTTNITQTSATFNWGAVSGAQNYSVQTRLPNGTWYDVQGSPFNGTSITVNGLNAATTYEWRVRANCGSGQYSNWTYPQVFTTLGGFVANDNCANAVELTVNSTCVSTSATNVGATSSAPAPSGECWTYGYKDVWFHFTMPNVLNPTVTIRTTAGTLNDAVMEVYTGTTCGNMTFLSCEDDNSNGNGSPMPVINLIGYQGANIWVRVWGYSGSTGSFNICVMDFQSNNLVSLDNDVDAVDGTTLEIIESEAAPVIADHVITPIAHVSPNPANDVLNITLAQTKDCTVTGLLMTDISGKIMEKQSYASTGSNEFREELNVSGLTPGIYILHIMTTTGIITEKVSVVHN